MNWRNFEGEVNIDLAPRVFLVGPNASGKSNVLDALRFLRDTADQGLQTAISNRGGMKTICNLNARKEFELAITVGNKTESVQWNYSLQVRIHPQRHVPEVVKEVVKISSNDSDNVLLDRRPKPEDDAEVQQTYLEQMMANEKFRPLMKFLKSIRYFHTVPQLIKGLVEPSAGGRSDSFGSSLLKTIAKTRQDVRNNRLSKITKALQAAIPQLKDLTVEQEGENWHLQVHFDHWRKSPARQDERALSDGTLRLIGLLWCLAEKGGPLLLEEPELSLHTTLVRRLPGLMTRLYRRSPRQLLITTHSPDLLNDPGIGLDEVHILEPSPQGTKIIPASDHQLTASLYNKEDNDYPLGEIIIPAIAPEQVGRFFMEE